MSSKGERHRSDSIPSRWLKCPPKSSELLINKFLIFKTPLSSYYDDQVKDDIFQVDLVFQSMKNKGVKLGLWIDLTNTTRFYDKKEVLERGCQYVKIQCVGHKCAPEENQTEYFIELCDAFIRNKPQEAIAVHCTHGFNRSGFLVVSYLIKKMDWEVRAAVAEFARIRPPGIYKQDYLLELYRRYDEVEYAPEAPPYPEWSYEEENVDGMSNENEKPKKYSKKNPPRFMEGISGVAAVDEPLLSEIRMEVTRLCNSKWNAFPGSQPVSLNMSNIIYLKKSPYMVSWKADGVRYLLYIRCKNEIYCVDRDSSVFRVNNLTFVYKRDIKRHLEKTLLDGEMVIDKVNGENIPRYLAYDIISIFGNDIREKVFDPVRYTAIKEEIVDPRIRAMMKGLIVKADETFSVRRKDFYPLVHTEKLLSDNFRKTLCHEPDGLVFQPSEEPYRPGRCQEVLKWKPLSMNSVDFRLKITTTSGQGILKKKIGELYVGGMREPYAYLSSIKDVKHLDSKIIECTYEGNQWVFMRERTDKSFPNHLSTVQSIIHSIREPITEKYLLDFIATNRYWK